MTKSIKKTLAFILSVMMLMSALPVTYSFADNDGDYEYTRSGSQATITKYNGSKTEVEIPENFGGSYATVVAIGNENGVDAFRGNTKIESVTVPDTVKVIGASSFMICTSLKTVVLGEGVETIDSRAFSGCSSLATVTIGANVKSIASDAFSSTNITTVNYGGTRAQWAALIGDIKDFGRAEIICAIDCEKNGHELGDMIAETPASCLVDGNVAYWPCVNCDKKIVNAITGEEIEDVTIPAGHKWEEATCTEPKSCSACDETEGEALGHSFTLYVYDNNATCLGNGTETAKCDRCDATDTLTRENSALDHSFTTYVSDNNATCEADGTKTAKCDRCEATDTVADEGSALGHRYTNYVSNNNATCTSNATETAKCDGCDLTDTREIADSALGHAWNDATCLLAKTCAVCGETDGDPLGHTEEIIAAVAATCTEAGSTEGKKCSVCGEVTVPQVTVEALGHSYDWRETKAPSCTAVGERVGTCSACDDVTTEELPLAEHTRVEGVYEAPTCTDNGYKGRVVCEVCGVTLEEGEIIPAAHKFELVAEVAPSCEGAGSKTYKCTECGETKSETVDALGHDYPENWTVILPATCTERGSQIKICGVCNNINSEIIPAFGHTKVIDAAVAPTCTETGLTEGFHCSVCNTVFVKQETVDALGHTWIDATCTAPKTCSVCNKTEGEALGHTPAEAVRENIVEATCYAEGSYEEVVYCSVEECEAELSREDKIIPPLGHDHVIDEEASTAPTCTEKGLNKFVCSRCGDTYSEDVDALGHDYVIDEDASTAPSCTEKGTDSYICVRCDDTYTEELDALGHNVTNWITSDSATCTKEGSRVGRCIVCYTVVREKTDKLDHKDENGDKKCDVCGTVLETEKPEDPTTPSDPVNPENPSQPDKPADPETPAEPDECSCYCHKSGIIRFFLFDIPLVFLRIFGLNKYCACGKAHY